MNNENKRKVCADIGCGSGQATKDLIHYFEKVYGIEPSQTQLSNAYKNGFFSFKKNRKNRIYQYNVRKYIIKR
jgi:SAM-dependent methyltransferase